MITNPTIETLLARRSVRAYKPEQITLLSHSVFLR